MSMSHFRSMYEPATALSSTLSMFLLTITLSCIFIIYSIARPYLFSKLRNVPGPSYLSGHPLWGQYPAILRSEAGLLQKQWSSNFGHVTRAVGPLGFERLVFTSTTAMRTILVENHRHFEKPRFVTKILGITTGPQGILAAAGSTHKHLRHWFAPMFSKRNTTQGRLSVSTQATKYCANLVRVLRQRDNAEDVVEMYPYVSKLALDVVASAIIGVEPEELGTDWQQVATAYHKVLGYQSGVNTTKFIGLLSIPGVYQFLQSKTCYYIVKRCERWVSAWMPALEPVCVTVDSMHTIRSAARTIVERRVQDNVSFCTAQDPKSRDFLDITTTLPQSQESDMEVPSVHPLEATDAMVDQVLAFVGAGHETISGAVSWTLWLLASHPDIQAELRKEIESFNPGDDLSTASLHRIPYLTAVIYESLRLFPPIPTSFREAIVDTWVDGVFVPKGTMIYIGIRAMNLLETYWGADAMQFRPHRWINIRADDGTTHFDATRPTGRDSSAIFLSFLVGSHACMGKDIALAELRIILVSLLRQFTFSPAYPGQKAQPTTGVTMTPADQLPLRVKLLDRE